MLLVLPLILHASRHASLLPPAARLGYIPGTSLTVHSGHIVYTFEAYISSQKEEKYALEGDVCVG